MAGELIEKVGTIIKFVDLLSDRLKKTESTLSRLENQIRDLYGRVRK